MLKDGNWISRKKISKKLSNKGGPLVLKFSKWKFSLFLIKMFSNVKNILLRPYFISNLIRNNKVRFWNLRTFLLIKVKKFTLQIFKPLPFLFLKIFLKFSFGIFNFHPLALVFSPKLQLLLLKKSWFDFSKRGTKTP